MSGRKPGDSLLDKLFCWTLIICSAISLIVNVVSSDFFEARYALIALIIGVTLLVME